MNLKICTNLVKYDVQYDVIVANFFIFIKFDICHRCQNIDLHLAVNVQAKWWIFANLENLIKFPQISPKFGPNFPKFPQISLNFPKFPQISLNLAQMSLNFPKFP